MSRFEKKLEKESSLLQTHPYLFRLILTAALKHVLTNLVFEYRCNDIKLINATLEENQIFMKFDLHKDEESL